MGPGWHLQAPGKRGGSRLLVFDSNHWKSFVAARLGMARGDRGTLSVFGSRAGEHRLFFEHLCSEYPVRTSGRGRECDEWKDRPGKPDNHWLDCLVGCAVAASVAGVTVPEARRTAPRRKRVNCAEAWEKKHGKITGNRRFPGAYHARG